MIHKNFALLALAATTALSFSTTSYADEKNSLEDVKTLKLCVDYSTLASDEEKAIYMKELDRRGQLSVQDHDNFAKKQVVNGSTMCGMYMTLGKPLAEKGKQLRPMVYKVVHVYPTHYYVSQVGMIVATYERKEGQLPPKLTEDKPKTQAPPVMYQSPGGTPMHH